MLSAFLAPNYMWIITIFKRRLFLCYLGTQIATKWFQFSIPLLLFFSTAPLTSTYKWVSIHRSYKQARVCVESFFKFCFFFCSLNIEIINSNDGDYVPVFIYTNTPYSRFTKRQQAKVKEIAMEFANKIVTHMQFQEIRRFCAGFFFLYFFFVCVDVALNRL